MITENNRFLAAAVQVTRAQLSCIIRCQSGIAAVEFALILPILIVLLLGTTELTRALTYDRKVSQIASTVADLAAQSSTLTSGDVGEIFKASEFVMQPYPGTGLGITLSSVEFDNDGNPAVSWSCGYGGVSGWSDGGLPPIEIPEAIRLPGTTVIIAVSSYTYKPLFNSVIPEDIELGETYYLRPRLVAKIPKPGC